MIMPTYVLEMPKEPEAQKELGIENVQLFNEASYVISAINPIPRPSSTSFRRRLL